MLLKRTTKQEQVELNQNNLFFPFAKERINCAICVRRKSDAILTHSALDLQVLVHFPANGDKNPTVQRYLTFNRSKMFILLEQSYASFLRHL